MVPWIEVSKDVHAQPSHLRWLGKTFDDCTFPMTDSDPIVFNEAQLILAEKRTHLAMLRTGIAIMALPMSIVSFLIVTSRYYSFQGNLFLMVPLLIVCTGLGILGGYMTVRSLLNIRNDALLLSHLKRHNKILSSFIQ